MVSANKIDSGRDHDYNDFDSLLWIRTDIIFELVSFGIPHFIIGSKIISVPSSHFPSLLLGDSLFNSFVLNKESPIIKTLEREKRRENGRGNHL